MGVLPQCACNSYMWKGSLRQWLRYIRDPWVVKSGGCCQGLLPHVLPSLAAIVLISSWW